jgi:hypothetical protein
MQKFRDRILERAYQRLVLAGDHRGGVLSGIALANRQYTYRGKLN